MEDQKFDGGPAFPSIEKLRKLHFGETPTSYEVDGGDGMTMRDYFAAKAMQGFLANQQQDYAPMVQKNMDAVVIDSYKIADAMLKARNA